MLKAEEDKRRAEAEAKRKADADAKTNADAEAKKKAEEAERQRLAMLKAEEDKKRAAEAEARRRADEEARRVPRPGDTFRDCDVCPEMVVVPAGEFMMGSNDSEDEKPAAQSDAPPAVRGRQV
jgi:formylglycine-generating enzyme required for sulfatase activity